MKPTITAPIPVLTLDRINLLKTRPIDLGTAWGLNRGKYIGILAGSASEDIFTYLIQVERLLFEAIGKISSPGLLKTRYWIRVDIAKVPGGPQGLRDVWHAAIEPDDYRVSYMRDKGLPENIIPGIYFEVDSKTLSPNTFENILNWCRGLIDCISPLQQLAVILNLAGAPTKRIIKIAIDLRNRIKEAGVEAIGPVEIMSPLCWPEEPDVANQGGKLSTRLLEDSNNSQAGIYLFSWIKDALDSSGLELDQLHNGSEYRSVVKAALSLREKLGDVYEKTSAAKKVVEDIDEVRQTIDDEFDSQFLPLIQSYRPERLIALIKAYAQSKSDETRYAALVFATLSDPLMNAWLDGIRWDYIPEVLKMHASAHVGPLVPPLVLALTQRYNRGHDREQVKNILEKCESELSLDLRALCLLTLGRVKAEDYLKTNRWERLLLAVKAGSGKKVLPDGKALSEQLKELELSVPEVWWALAMLPPCVNRIVSILTLDANCRAVLGLCTESEWSTIQCDSELEQQIITCRDGRPISFSHSL